MSNILVTGGKGTIGKPLVSELRKRYHMVWTADISHDSEPRSIRCDVASYMQLSRLFKSLEFDFVYHLAAEVGRWSGEEYYDSLWRTNVIGTKNIINLQERYGFKLIFFSTSEVYGDYPETISEDVMERYAVRPLTDYALSKWVNEHQIMNSERMYGTESVRVRPFNLYGPGEYYTEYRSVVTRFIYYALKRIPYTVYTGHKRTFTYIDDAVMTVANIAEKFIPGRAYNIASREYHDIKAVSDIVLECVGGDDSIVTYEESEPSTVKNKQVDIQRAINELDHDPRISLREGLSRTVNWMKEIYGGEND